MRQMSAVVPGQIDRPWHSLDIFCSVSLDAAKAVQGGRLEHHDRMLLCEEDLVLLLRRPDVLVIETPLQHILYLLAFIRRPVGRARLFVKPQLVV
ncbi:hypothetical protein BAUCODRAFT_344914 [Baudoinia panamericana UAMH 10762]|uniref:Uncharacterized protein n=1 Tax=Baudoinia panamericana (strain UAMH 10762) TaxID=717646 RepID=M2NKJ7_BAUPA|nr:uncharacterized protein BAUCODRAFT_344914 [Baudoinia panamericana UAMH 10762]EMC99655.1 hypothetical protein BAUCODRAFT_344914 [Baudoinia panamericana UAMH 10762]